MEIRYTPSFHRAFKKLPRDIQKKAREKEKILRENGFDVFLKIHKLKGKFSSYLSFSVNHSYRIIMDIISDNEIHFLMIGNHDIYK